MSHIINVALKLLRLLKFIT